MPEWSAEQIAEQANWLDESAHMLQIAAKKMRDAAEILAAIDRRHPGGLRSVIEGASRTAGHIVHGRVNQIVVSPAPAAPDQTRMRQIEQILQMYGPMHRNQLLDVAEHNGIPRNTASAYLTKENFVQDNEGRWWTKGASWPSSSRQGGQG
ncbi:MAG TPA: hypothetical protein VG055_23810 [Planctomycetaceae bacterium]|jgi:hypothetical protein|nr:hypothetical protein [Planctomycetaceae bacterium]